MKLFATIIFFSLSFAEASVFDTTKVFVPRLHLDAQIRFPEELRITEAYVESYTDFIQCIIACNYDLKTSKKNLSVAQLSPDQVRLTLPKMASTRFSKLGARVNECGASIVIKGESRGKVYYTRFDLYKMHSKASKKSCEKSEGLLREIEERLSRPMELFRWVEVD